MMKYGKSEKYTWTSRSKMASSEAVLFENEFLCFQHSFCEQRLMPIVLCNSCENSDILLNLRVTWIEIYKSLHTLNFLVSR